MVPGYPLTNLAEPGPLDVTDLLDFDLPPERAASEPPEARGLARDAVRLMVSYASDDRIIHTQFRDIVDYLDAGDVLVINTSATLKAALPATRADGTSLLVHVSTRLPGDLWIVEVRQPEGHASKPFFTAEPGESLSLPDGGSVTLLTPHNAAERSGLELHTRLWIATLSLPDDVLAYLDAHGSPIRYDYVRQPWPIEHYQTVYANEPGSAEMPSAGRAFTPDVIMRLAANGVQIAPLVLHTGVASQEEGELPYEEYYRVPVETARVVNAARAEGRRVVAVGTTVVRALETAAEPNGIVYPGDGWTRMVVTPQRGVFVVDALLTGLHEPKATHLAMLEAVAGRRHLSLTYRQAMDRGYLWHEFGDLHLVFRF